MDGTFNSPSFVRQELAQLCRPARVAVAEALRTIARGIREGNYTLPLRASGLAAELVHAALLLEEELLAEAEILLDESKVYIEGVQENRHD